MMKRLAGLLAALILICSAPASAGISAWDGSSWRNLLTPYAWDGSSWRTGVQGWAWDGSAWRAAYSTISASASNTTGSGSGGAASGPVSSNSGPNAVIGGFPFAPVTYQWNCTSGPCPSVNQGSATPTFSATVGNASCQNSITQHSVWNLVATDAIGTQTQSNSFNVDLTWNNLTSCYTPHTIYHTTPGDGTETIPAGAPSVTIYVAGGGGGGGASFYDISTGVFWGGQGGGSGGWTSSTYPISSGQWGTGINYHVGAGAGQYNAVAGTSSASGGIIGGGISAAGGVGGIGGKQPCIGGTGGSPNGVNGTCGGQDSAGAGGVNAIGQGNGADGALDSSGGGNGNPGAVIFQWN